MQDATQINSVFYALRMLSHGLDTSEIGVVEGDEYPGSEFTAEEQAVGLRIIHDIEMAESSASNELAPERLRVHIDALAAEIEDAAERELEQSGFPGMKASHDQMELKERHVVDNAWWIEDYLVGCHDPALTEAILLSTTQRQGSADSPDFVNRLLDAVEKANALKKVANITGFSYRELLMRIMRYRSLKTEQPIQESNRLLER